MATSLLLPLQRMARQTPAAPALSGPDRTRSADAVMGLVARMAAELHRQGVRDGDRVALHAASDDAYLLAILAILWAGGVATPLNERWAADEIAAALADCTPRLLITGSGDRAAYGLPSTSIAELIAAQGSPAPASGRCDRDLALLVYTGGTTGRSKGVMISHAGLYASAASFAAFDGGMGNTVLQFAPLFHIAAINVGWAALLAGRHQIFLAGFEPGAVLNAIATRAVTDMFVVPTMLQAIIDDPRFRQHDVSSLRRVSYGASPIPDALLDRALATLPNVGFVQAYGMTEMSPVVTLLAAHDHRDERLRRSAGRATLMTDVRIVGDDEGELPRGRIGEIVAQGCGLMLGYWGREEQTRRALRGGWMHTGDLGYMDDDGYVFVVDRLKDMIISGGENVYSAEVESVLSTHPLVSQCAIIGVPHAHWGESVHAVVVPVGGGAITLDDLQRHCRSRLAGYKIPRSFEVRDVMPTSAAGKLLKTVLREDWVDAARRRGDGPRSADREPDTRR